VAIADLIAGGANWFKKAFLSIVVGFDVGQAFSAVKRLVSAAMDFVQNIGMHLHPVITELAKMIMRVAHYAVTLVIALADKL